MQKKNFLMGLLIISVATSIFWAYLYGRLPIGGDAETYDTTAMAINTYGPVKGFSNINQYISRPLYPVFLALVFKIFGHSYFFPILFQMILSVITVFLVFNISEQIFGEKTARLSSLLMVIFPSLWAYSGILMREVLSVFLITLLTFFLYKAQTHLKIIYFIIIGFILGLLALLNAITELFIIFITIFFIYLAKKKIHVKVLLKNLLAMSLVFFIIFGGWFIFIKSKIQNPVIAGDTPALLLMEKYERMQNIKNNYPVYFIAHALGDFFAYKIDKNYDKNTLRLGYNSRKQYDGLLKIMTVKEVDRLFLKNALMGFIEHPLLFFGQNILEILKFISPLAPLSSMQPLFAQTHENIPDIIKAIIIIILRILWVIFYLVIPITIIKKRKELEKIGWLVVIIFYYFLFYISIYAIARYSLPLYPLYIILFSAGALELLKKNSSNTA